MPACWIEISRAALAQNLRAIQALIGPDVKIIAVVKGNAYGYGVLECSRIFAEAGAAMLAVTHVDEAVPLREGGIDAPILLLAPALPDEYETVVQLGLTASVSTIEESRALSALALKLDKTVALHLKVNTGMNRFGSSPEFIGELAGSSRRLPNLKVEGAFTHFANATAKDEAPTKTQFEEFENATCGLKEMMLHTCGSAATLRFPEMRLNAVRPGSLLYGQFPTPEMSKLTDIQLKDPFTPKARVMAIQNVKAGAKYGYGSEWTAPRDSKLAIVSCGFADGMTMQPNARVESPLDAIKKGLEQAARLLKNPNAGRAVTVRGQKAFIVGRVGMQTCAVDISKVEGVSIGDEVIVPMRRLAAGQNLPRVYLD